MSDPAEAAKHRYVSDIAFSPAVKAAQSERGSRAAYARMEQKGGWQDQVTGELAAYLAERDSFYFATASRDGQPYIQHRGGPAGFLKVIDEKTLAFADFGGNRQYISVGNLAENDRVFLFLIDYANRRRLKIWGRAKAVEDDPALLEKLIDPAYEARPERAIVVAFEACDWNCPSHIVRRFSEHEVFPAIEQLRSRIAELEAELTRLRAGRQGA
jgi:predicted pyridoxine 5'-phosphate oxidase superfamily flavin-nucleotide-binding protein